MTRKLTLLAILEAAGERGATTAELLQGGVGSRYSARLMELRAEGYTIEGVREREGSWRYRLLDSPRPPSGGAVRNGGDGVPCVSDAVPPALFDAASEPTPHWAPDAA